MGGDAAKLCRPHQRLEQKCQEPVDPGIDQDMAAGEGRAAEWSRDDAHDLRRGRGRCIDALDRRRDAAGTPGEELEHCLDGKSESQPEERQSGGMTRDCGGKPGQETTCMSRSNQGASTRCSERVTFRSNAWLRISLDEGEQAGEDGERGQPECHRAASPGERPARRERPRAR